MTLTDIEMPPAEAEKLKPEEFGAKGPETNLRRHRRELRTLAWIA